MGRGSTELTAVFTHVRSRVETETDGHVCVCNYRRVRTLCLPAQVGQRPRRTDSPASAPASSPDAPRGSSRLPAERADPAGQGPFAPGMKEGLRKHGMGLVRRTQEPDKRVGRTSG